MITGPEKKSGYTVLDGWANNETSPYLRLPLRTLSDAQKLRNMKADRAFAQSRRMDKRRAVRKVAFATTENSTRPVNCVVLDISKVGARIQITDTISHSSELIKISIPDIGLITDCVQKWRQGDEAGIIFDF